jgi:hypothetical protein
MSKTSEWQEIMGGLRGRRLAVLDELCCGLIPNTDDLKVQEALGWLVFNCFVSPDGDRLVPRNALEAQKVWRERGPARETAGRLFSHVAPVAPPTPPPLPTLPAATIEEPTKPTPGAVHAMRPSQPELFA